MAWLGAAVAERLCVGVVCCSPGLRMETGMPELVARDENTK
jgi:hypothetical protein